MEVLTIEKEYKIKKIPFTDFHRRNQRFYFYKSLQI